jgi:acyl-coenzyme A synthetase/AMP-(fatty) acid ligase
LCWRAGQPIARRRFLQEVRQLAAALPEGGPVLAMTSDRYLITLALAAAAVRGEAALMPPNYTPDMVRRLRALFPAAYVLAEPGQPALDLPTLPFPDLRPAPLAEAPPPVIPAGHEVAHVLTSGSTGDPMPHGKRWDLLVANVRGAAARIAEYLGRPDLAGVTVVGTVPAHHMYGFESTVLIGALGGAAFAAERPFFAQDIAATLASVPRPRVLVTTPLHLKTLLDAAIDVPALDLVVSATAPLPPQLAQRSEQALGAPLVEIYGCTEAGQVATRRTTEGPEWQAFPGLVLSGDGERVRVSGGHVAQPTPLADVLEVLSPTRVRLLGRSNDLINVAGKRSSLAHLNHHLNSVPGVHDGAFWLPPDEGDASVVRLVAVVVAPDVSREQLLGALRQRVDAAFLPRRILRVDSLPRDPTGKLPARRLAELATRLLAEPGDA